jgi:hypothetical protein
MVLCSQGQKSIELVIYIHFKFFLENCQFCAVKEFAIRALNNNGRVNVWKVWRCGVKLVNLNLQNLYLAHGKTLF